MGATAVDALMRHAIDYAGVFPPAQLGVADALTEYARVRDGEHGWVLGSFVLASDHIRNLTPGAASDIPLSVVMRQATAEAVAGLLRDADRLTVAAIEIPPIPAGDVRAIAAAAPPLTRVFFEVAPGDDLDTLLDAVAGAGACAKIRTGGITAEAFPAPESVYQFLRACLVRRVVCKATAGLHHAVVGRYPLTYEPESPRAPMFGFLTVSAAAALVYVGAPQQDVIAVLTESQAAAITVDADGLRWRDYLVPTQDLEATRRTLFSSFGSCSAQEPIDDLVSMRLL
jgi:hypothetical protein